MPGEKQQITIRTTSCEMSYRWVLSLRQQANLYCHILIILDRKKHGFLQSRTSLNSPRTTILIHFFLEKGILPPFPKISQGITGVTQPA